MKRIHILESMFHNLFENSSYNEAGTDFPKYFDVDNQMFWEASWDDGEGVPFGVWLSEGNKYEFFVGEEYDTHETICCNAARGYLKWLLTSEFEESADAFVSELEYLIGDVEEYDSETKTYKTSEGEECDLSDWVVEYSNSLPYEIALDAAETAISEGETPYYDELAEKAYEAVFEEYDLYDGDANEYDKLLKEYTHYTFNTFFQEGYDMGRIWPEKCMLQFYISEQPSPDELRKILMNIVEHSWLNVTYDELLEFFTIFYDYDNDGEITGCTVGDYMIGNYGPDTKDGGEADLDRERTFGDKNTQFIPHLASPEEKKRRGFYNGWFEANARKWGPRLRGFNGNMAAYRAARYPYSDSRIIKGNVLSENNKR